jgi:hypothetical protein
MPVPAASAARTAASRSADSLGRPKAFPLLVPFARALAMPAAMRSWMIERWHGRQANLAILIKLATVSLVVSDPQIEPCADEPQPLAMTGAPSHKS